MKKIFTTKPLVISLMATSFCFATATAHASTTLLDENFDVGMPASSLTQGGGSVNLRLGTDTINTYNGYQRFSFASGTTFFDSSASNKFLVLGDDSGQLAGSPDKGTFGFAMPFSVVNGTTDVSFSFDWVFKAFVLGGSNGSTDRFVAGVAGDGFSITDPMNLSYYIVDQSIASQGALQGPANVTTALSNLGTADSNGLYHLVFGLLENTGSSPTTNSAIGIDNVKIQAQVSAVPVPAAVWSFLTGFMGLLALGRRKQSIA